VADARLLGARPPQWVDRCGASQRRETPEVMHVHFARVPGIGLGQPVQVRPPVRRKWYPEPSIPAAARCCSRPGRRCRRRPLVADLVVHPPDVARNSEANTTIAGRHRRDKSRPARFEFVLKARRAAPDRSGRLQKPKGRADRDNTAACRPAWRLGAGLGHLHEVRIGGTLVQAQNVSSVELATPSGEIPAFLPVLVGHVQPVPRIS